MFKRFLFPILVLFLLACPSRQASSLGERALPELSHKELLNLVSSPDPAKNVDPSNPSSHLSKILIPRVPETDNNTLVRKYIISTLQALDWHIEEDEFINDTPLRPTRFTNIIATKDPTASRRIVLSAHYDSKYFSDYPDNQFVGATDSAASCAMMLDLAEALNPLLDKRKERLEAGVEDDDDIADITLQLVFFDGEEAYISWTDKDSTYGSRHLAEKWDTTYLESHGKRRLMGIQSTELSGVEHLILLDLLGAPQPSIRSYFSDTTWLFDAMVSAESRLGKSGAFAYSDEKGMEPGQWKSYFSRRTTSFFGYIGDDHVPFLQKGVSVLHIIPEPFPRVWHKLTDDATALDLPTMRRWNLILRVFMSEYLHLRSEDAETASMLQRSNAELVGFRFLM